MTKAIASMIKDASSGQIQALDVSSVHRISSGQVVIDLQTAVKELLENSLDAGATSVEIRLKDHGLGTIEVVDNGSGIAPEDYDAMALKHHTSKLSSFSDLTALHTFGFRGEALSSLCALAEKVTVTTATAADAPMGTVIELDCNGRVTNRQGRVARQRGTTVSVTGLFKPLPVRRKELERNAKREFGKALALLSAYALVPCAQENRGVRLTVIHFPIGGKKSVQLRTDGTPSTRASVSALWGPKALEHLVNLDLHFEVETERSVLRRQGIIDAAGRSSEVRVRGLISKFAVGCGRTGTDRQFFFINGRPCNPSKVQKAFNEVYRTYNANQAPFIVADFVLPADSCDVNVSPDKRTILLHSENNLVQALKVALDLAFAPSRATYDVNSSITSQFPPAQGSRVSGVPMPPDGKEPLFLEDGDDDAENGSVEGDTHGTFGTPPLLLGQQDAGNVTMDVDDRRKEELSSPVVARPGPLTQDDTRTRDRESSSSAHSMSRGPTVTPGSDTEVSHSDSHRPPSSLVDQDRDPELSDWQMHIGTGDASPTVTQLRGMIADSGSPSARQASSEKSVQREGERNVARMPVLPVEDGSSAVRVVEQKGSSADTGGVQSVPRDVQMVLSTTGASWCLQRSAEDDLAPPSKRVKVSADIERREGRDARQDLRAKLREFARSGTQITDDDANDETPEADEEEQDELHADTEDMMSVEMDEQVPSSEIDGLSRQDVETEEQGREGPESFNSSVEPHVIDLTADGLLDQSQSVSQPHSDLMTSAVSSPSSTPSHRLSRPEVIRTGNGEDVSLRFSMSRLASSWRRLQDRLSDVLPPCNDESSAPLRKDAGIANAEDDSKAVEALSRVIAKTDFATMEIVGQFNLGFIITRRKTCMPVTTDRHADTEVIDDLFIVDQHAADEKYNFETLQQTTKIESQKLFRPQPLELTAADVLLATENVDVLRQNGFEIAIDESVTPGEGHRLKLVAQPTSKSTVFDMKDLEELLHLMQDRPTGQMVRCSKARVMFAMRACRKSVMVGMPLSTRQMTSVVRHMGTMEQPWNCPHGRPTMRHLSDIAGIGRDWRQEKRRDIKWANLGR